MAKIRIGVVGLGGIAQKAWAEGMRPMQGDDSLRWGAVKVFADGSAGGLTGAFEARRCLACDPPPCAAACPTGAFAPRPGGGVIVRKKLCIRCGQCAAACPVEAVFLDQGGEPFVCLHCGRCVAFCPHDCLEMVEKAVTREEER